MADDETIGGTEDELGHVSLFPLIEIRTTIESPSFRRATRIYDTVRRAVLPDVY